MSENTFLRNDGDTDYIVGWRYKYDFKSGKYDDNVMTYGEASKRANELNKENPEIAHYPMRAARLPSKFDAESMGKASH